jgi:hypothetical protein
MIFIESVKKSKNRLNKKYPNSKFIDITSKAVDIFVKFSPFFPHHDIPIPNSPNIYSETVEGVWQGLKVFRHNDIDISKFYITNMKGIKRLTKYFGQPIGHRNGINGEVIDYISARKLIYIPTYKWVLDNKLIDEISILLNLAINYDIVLLDFETNCDIENISKPLSHAFIVKQYLEELNPEIFNSNISFNLDQTEKEQLKFNQLRLDL